MFPNFSEVKNNNSSSWHPVYCTVRYILIKTIFVNGEKNVTFSLSVAMSNDHLLPVPRVPTYLTYFVLLSFHFWQKEDALVAVGK